MCYNTEKLVCEFDKFLFQMLLIISMICLTMARSNGANPGQQSRPKVSDDQLEGALSDKRYLLRQLKCALGEAPCDPVGRRLKSKFHRRGYIEYI